MRASAIAFINASTHITALLLAGVTLVLVGQPIYANDTWIHLALGEAFAAGGPWLANDPHLFAAPGPPAPSSWLGALGLYGTYNLFGFTGLRLLHGAAVAGIFVLVWCVVRRATRSRSWASLGLIGFIALSTYRLVQLRPHLFTIAAVFLLYLLLIGGDRASRQGLAPWRIAVAAGVSAVWANVHAAFVLGPLLILGTSASLFAAAWIVPAEGEKSKGERARARGLGLAGLCMALATLANPEGISAHLSYFRAGGETLGLGSVIDEWGRTNLFAWPAANLPPTPAAWWVCWLGVFGVIAGALAFFGRVRGVGDEASGGASRAFDPALLALSVAGLGAALFATRFLWLAVFPLALLGAVLVSRFGDTKRGALGVAGFGLGLSAALSLAHFTQGDWPLVSKPLYRADADYSQPYRAAKYHANAIWFLADAELEGRIYNDYTLGGFMSFWLAPRIQMSSSGTMNVELGAMETNLLIGEGGGSGADQSLSELLDRQGVDLFLGTGLPIWPPPNKPFFSTTRYLEGKSDWLLIFRSARNAVYLRLGPRQESNLARVDAYYARVGVPFDPAVGFDVQRVIVESPEWAIDHGLIPKDFDQLVGIVRQLQSRGDVDMPMRRLSIVYSIIGLYERAARVDQWILHRRPDDVDAAWRLMWVRLQARQFDEAIPIARELADGPMAQAWAPSGLPSVETLESATAAERHRMVVRWPLLRNYLLPLAQRGFQPPTARARRQN